MQMSAQYMTTGTISPILSSSFFIKNCGNEEAIIDYNKLPEGFNQNSALSIQETGKFIAHLRSLEIQSNFNEQDLFDDHAGYENGFIFSKPMFDDNLKKIQRGIRLKYIEELNGKTFSDVLKNYHQFAFHLHEYFWFNLFDECFFNENVEKNNSNIRKMYRKTLFLTYGYEIGKSFEENVCLIINPQSKFDDFLQIKLDFVLSPIAQLWLHKSHRKKYQKIFYFLTKLLQTKYKIMKVWKAKKKFADQKIRSFLLHWCCKTITTFYSYSKVSYGQFSMFLEPFLIILFCF